MAKGTPRKDFAEMVTRRFRIERGSEGEVERVYVEGVNAKGRRHWSLAWTGKQAGLSWLDVSWLLSIDLVVPPQALDPRQVFRETLAE
jgi:hypothetical protein